jgi:DnaJ-class molecular chaperone
MKSRRHHNNTALTSTKKGKRKKEIAAIRRKLLPICMDCDGCGWCEGSPAWTCTKCNGTGVEQREETPGYGHGV